MDLSRSARLQGSLFSLSGRDEAEDNGELNASLSFDSIEPEMIEPAAWYCRQ